MAQPVTKNYLSQNQIVALSTLIETGSTKKAAQSAGVAAKTVYAWLKEPRFSQALREAENTAVRAVSRQIILLAKKAVACLAVGMQSGQDMRVRLRAADIYFTKALAWLEHADIDRRLSALEDRYKEEKP